MRCCRSFWLVLGVLGSFALPVAAEAPVHPLLVTVDDLPITGSGVNDPVERTAITNGLLAALAKHKIHAVAVVTWNNVHSQADERLLERWLAAGHELGNHSFAHLNYTRTRAKDYIDDVERARLKVAALMARQQKVLRFFRFPFLCEGDTREKLQAMREYLASSAQRNLPVTIDTQDWSFDKPWREAVKANDVRGQLRVAEQYHEALHVAARYHTAHGDELFARTTPQILLLHANSVGAANWDKLFQWFAASGYRFAEADEVLGDPVFAEPHDFVFTHGVSLWARLDRQRRWRQTREQVEKLLVDQSAAWTRGDIDAFCSVYADDTLFVAPTGVTQGRQAVVERYKKRYPTTDDMGALTLTIQQIAPIDGLEISMLDDAVPSDIHGVTVVARWELKRPAKEDLSGSTLLVLQRRAGKWWITRDASM